MSIAVLRAALLPELMAVYQVPNSYKVKIAEFDKARLEIC